MLVEGFALFNPHATITLDWFGEKTTWKATNTAWKKWKPSDPTSAHWYELPHLERLVGAYVTLDREKGTDRLVSDFVAEFDGLSGSRKRTLVLDSAGLFRARLSELVAGDQFDHERIGKLLAAMQKNSRPVQSARLGVIGEDHLRTRLLKMGVEQKSFRYRRKLAKSKNPQGGAGDQLASFFPYVVETAFGYLGSQSADRRRIYTGANWSADHRQSLSLFRRHG